MSKRAVFESCFAVLFTSWAAFRSLYSTTPLRPAWQATRSPLVIITVLIKSTTLANLLPLEIHTVKSLDLKQHNHSNA